MKQEATITISKCGETSLAHIDGGKLHAILLDSLRVRLFNDDGYWFAQGLEIDHFAQGQTEEKAKLNFISSLKSTIKHHLELYGHLKNLTIPAPKEVLDEARLAPVQNKLTHADIYDLSVKDIQGAKETEIAGFLPPQIVFLGSADGLENSKCVTV